MVKAKYTKGELGFWNWSVEEHDQTKILLKKLRETFFKEACKSIEFKKAFANFEKNASVIEFVLPLGVSEGFKDLTFEVDFEDIVDAYIDHWEGENHKKTILSKKLRKLADKIDKSK